MPGLERCTVVLEGGLNGQADERLAHVLGALDGGGELVLDLRSARSLEAARLAQLVRLLQAHRDRISIRILGLREQERRLLCYLGYDPDRPGASPGSHAQGP